MSRDTPDRSRPVSDLPALSPIALGDLPSRPLVTVAIANYNYARYVGQAIVSALGQSYPHVEVVVVDDGSTDDSASIIEDYARRDRRVTFVRKPNGGMASAWNVAWRNSRGEIWCPLDADDLFDPRKLEVLVEQFARHPRSGLAVHSMIVRDGEGREVQRLPFLTRFERGWLGESVLRRGGRWRYMPTSAIGLRRALGDRLFPIEEGTFRMHADALVTTLAPLLTEVIAVDEPLSTYRVHGSNSLGGGVRDLATAVKVIEFTRRTTEGVNARLAALEIPHRLDMGKNLEYVQAAYVRGLLDGTRRPALLRQGARLVGMLARDDLYGRAQRLLGLLVYGVAWALPRRARPWWIGRTLGYSRLKGRIRALLGRLRPGGGAARERFAAPARAAGL